MVSMVDLSHLRWSLGHSSLAADPFLLVLYWIRTIMERLTGVPQMCLVIMHVGQQGCLGLVLSESRRSLSRPSGSFLPRTGRTAAPAYSGAYPLQGHPETPDSLQQPQL